MEELHSYIQDFQDIVFIWVNNLILESVPNKLDEPGCGNEDSNLFFIGGTLKLNAEIFSYFSSFRDMLPDSPRKGSLE